jgi:hypothetical protein
LRALWFYLVAAFDQWETLDLSCELFVSWRRSHKPCSCVFICFRKRQPPLPQLTTKFLRIKWVL